MLSAACCKVIPELRCGEVNGGFYMLHCNTRTRHFLTAWSFQLLNVETGKSVSCLLVTFQAILAASLA